MSNESNKDKIIESSNRQSIRLWFWLKNKFLNPNSPELTWQEYEQHLNFYKFYLDIALKANVFFYAIVGAILIVVYDPAKKQMEPYAKGFFLMAPFIISLALGGVFLCGAVLWFTLAFRINRAVKRKEIRVKVPPFIQLLTGVLVLLGGIFVVVAVYLFKMMRLN